MAPSPDELVLGYWKIRGLAAAPRMMFYYAGQDFTDRVYGEDADNTYFGRDKPALAEKNACINLPYVIDGDLVLTQSNSILLFLGKKLGINKDEFFFHNHQALDQAMDWRNDTMQIVYPIAAVKTKDDFPAALRSHMDACAATHLRKLQGFCVGPFMCGPVPQSADFHVFELVEHHIAMCEEQDVPFDLSAYPKLQALHQAMLTDPRLSTYFAADCYTQYAFNDPVTSFFLGKGYGGSFGPTVEVKREILDPKN